MKRTLLLICTLLCANVLSAQTWFWVDSLQYKVTSTNPAEVEVYSANSSITTAIIPAIVTYQGTEYSVTAIGEWAFYNRSSLTSVTIPNSVTTIEYWAFFNCSSLTSVTLGNSVTSIGGEAFSGCSSLTSVTIPNSVTSIGDFAFNGCSSLTSVTCLRSNSPSLGGNNVFDGTPNNKTLTIPCGCESEYADWQNATTWASIDCIETIGSRFTIGDLTYEITSETEVKVQACTQSATSVVIPETVTYQGTTYSVTSIGATAFAYCSSLTSVTIPNSVTSIGNYAFQNCSSLTSVTIPNSVTSIGNSAFWGCSSLTSVTIPNSVTSIGNDAFRGCSSLTSVTIPNSLTSIGNYVFRDCSSLTSITIPNSVTSIGNYAFYGCSSLTSITIPNSVTSIGRYAFANCSSLTSVTCLRSNSPSLDSDVFDGTPNNKTLTIPCGCESEYADWQNATTWASIDCIETIGSRFTIGDLTYEITSETEVKVQACTQSATSVVIPETVTYQGTTYSVTSIGDWAFSDCSSLTSVTIPNSVISIGYAAFASCISLTSVDIPNSVTSIGGLAFHYCTGLESINLSDNITSIGRNCFDSCINLTTVNIPTSLSVIDTSLFRYCTSLTSVTIPNSVTSIGYAAFYYCSSLTSVTIPNSVTSIGWYAFQSCSSLTSVAIPNSVTSIGYAAFGECSSLTSVTLGNSVTSIVDWAFAYCSSLTSVTCLANTPPYLGDDVFYNTPSNKILNVNCGLKDDYISYWTDFYSYNIHEIPFVVNATANDEAFGSVAVENNCSTATLSATANNCYQFVSWNDGNTDNPRIVNLTSDTSFIATFEEINFNTELSATICQGQVYTENNFNVSEAGVYNQNLTSVNGCDSIVTLTLNVNPIYNTELTATICQGQTYTENNFNVSEAGVYTQTLTSVNGCDSIVTLTVSVNPTFDTTINATINAGETYAEYGFNESESGTYVQNLQTEAGCDSTITLNLTVNSSLYDVAELTEITFYPNPTSGKVTFSKEIEKIEVIDNIGKVVMRFFDTNEINIETLPSGAYYLRITIGDKTIMRKVIKE